MSLLTLKVAQGINCDSMPEDLAAGQWSDGRNVRFRNGFAERMRGSTQVFAVPTVTPYYVTPYAVPTGRYVVHAGLQRVFADSGAARVDLTQLTYMPVISAFSYSGTTVTATFSAAHGRTTGDSVVFSGFVADVYNGTYPVTVTSSTVLTYTVPTAPTAPAAVIGVARFNATQLFTGARDDRWSGGSLNGVLVLNNGRDMPVFWGGDASQKLQTLPGWSPGDRAAFLIPFKNYLIALDITRNGVRYPFLLKGSAAAEPGNIPTSWNIADASQDAIEVSGELASTPDPIVGAAVLGDVLIVYKERSMFVVRMTGDSKTVFAIQRIQGTDGMLARGCVADTPVGHVVLGNGDVVVHQGQGARSIVEGRMRRWLFANLDASKKARAFVVQNPKCAEVWICFASVYSQACDRALVWNWNDDTLAVRTLPGVNYGAVGQIPAGVLPNTWATDQQRWIDDVTVWTEDEFGSGEAVLLLARDAPLIAIAETGGTDSGAPLVAYLERRAMDLDDPYTRKLVRGVLPRMASGLAGTQVTVRAGGAMVSNEAPAWTDPVPFSIGNDEKVDLFSSGRYVSLRVDSTSIQPWRMRSLGLDVQPQGRF